MSVLSLIMFFATSAVLVAVLRKYSIVQRELTASWLLFFVSLLFIYVGIPKVVVLLLMFVAFLLLMYSFEQLSRFND